MQGGDREPAVTPTLAVVGHRERRGRTGVSFLGGEASGFLGIGGGGVEDLQQSPTQDPERTCVVVACLGEQERLRLGDRVGVDRSVGRSSTASTITRAWSTVTSAWARAVSTSGWASSAVASRAARWTAGRVVRVWWASQFAADVAPTSVPTGPFGLSEQPELQLRHLRRQIGHLDQRGAELVGGIDHTGVPATDPNSVRTEATTAETGCA